MKKREQYRFFITYVVAINEERKFSFCQLFLALPETVSVNLAGMVRSATVNVQTACGAHHVTSPAIVEVVAFVILVMDNVCVIVAGQDRTVRIDVKITRMDETANKSKTFFACGWKFNEV